MRSAASSSCPEMQPVLGLSEAGSQTHSTALCGCWRQDLEHVGLGDVQKGETEVQNTLELPVLTKSLRWVKDKASNERRSQRSQRDR